MFAYLICLKYLLPGNTEKEETRFVCGCMCQCVYVHAYFKFPAVNVQKKLYMETMKKGQHCMLLTNALALISFLHYHSNL